MWFKSKWKFSLFFFKEDALFGHSLISICLNQANFILQHMSMGNFNFYSKVKLFSQTLLYICVLESNHLHSFSWKNSALKMKNIGERNKLWKLSAVSSLLLQRFRNLFLVQLNLSKAWLGPFMYSYNLNILNVVLHRCHQWGHWFTFQNSKRAFMLMSQHLRKCLIWSIQSMLLLKYLSS